MAWRPVAGRIPWLQKLGIKQRMYPILLPSIFAVVFLRICSVFNPSEDEEHKTANVNKQPAAKNNTT